MRKHHHLRSGFILLALLSILTALTACSPETQALRNVVEYQVRKAFPPVLVYRDPPPPGSLAGVIRDSAGNPLPGAVALVSTVRGQVYQSRSDTQGLYHIDGLPPGRYVPMAGAWGYDAINGPQVQVRPGQTLTGIDFQLPIHQTQPVEPANLRIGQPRQENSNFPEPMVATRVPFSFTLDGLTIDNGQIYLPAQPPAEPKSTLVIIYPSHPLNWNAASVALTRDGNALLALGPDGDRGLDMAGHVRDYRAVLQLWREGQLVPLGKPDQRWFAMSGSFSSLILFPALRDLPEMPPAIVSVGAVGDAFLGVQALYDADLAIPPPYDSAVAALGRPDKDPAFFFGFSPVFFAGKLPPTLVVHTYNDEVIPYTQAETLGAALTLAGVPHELLLYEDTTHYLDAYHPTPGTQLVYERVLEYVNTPVSRSAP